MGQRLPVIGFVLAVILAIFLFTQQQTTTQNLQNAQTAQAELDDRRSTAQVQAQAAATTQSQAEAGRVTAVALAQNAGTAQAESDTGRETAVAEAKAAGTLSAQIAAAATGQAGTLQAVQAAASEQAGQQVTLDAQSTVAMSTLQAQIDTQATTQAGFDAALGTATAQVDLAEFARQAAEDDRATALAQFWVAATVIAAQSDTQSTAQAVASGVTAAPTLPPTPTLAPTTAVEATPLPLGTIPPLTETYTTNDKKLTLNYPQGWVAGEANQGVILVVSSSAILQRSSSDLQSGEVEIQMIVGPVTSIRGVTAGAKPLEALQAVRTIYQSQNVSNMGDPTELTLGQNAAARFSATEGNNAALITIVDLGNDTIALTFAYTYPGEMDKFVKGIDDVLASLQYHG